MARLPLASETAGTVAVVVLARPDSGPGGKIVVPDEIHASAAARRGWRVGDTFEVGSGQNAMTYVVTRWRGLVRVADADGKIDGAPVNGKDIADLVLLLFRTGARIGEIGGLR